MVMRKGFKASMWTVAGRKKLISWEVRGSIEAFSSLARSTASRLD